MDSANFGYKDLKNPRNEIRLLKFVSKRGHRGPLEFELRQVRLDTKQGSVRVAADYTTLSYAWGDPKPAHLIFVNGKRFRIAANLHDALQTLCSPDRAKDKKVNFWIDAICINQAKAREKVPQIEIMRQIYSGAKRRFAWLGPRYQDSDLALNKLAQLGIDASEFGLGSQTAFASRTSLVDFISCGRFCQVDDPQRCLEAINNLLQRDYFHRLWVFQELAFSQDTLVLCGDQVTTWELFFNAVMALIGLNNLCEDLSIILHRPSKQMNEREAASERFYRSWIDQFRSFRIRSPLIQALQRYSGGDIRELQTRRKLVALLDTTKTVVQSIDPLTTLKARNPNDRIFALLGLALDSEDLGLKRPEYESPVTELYTLVAEQIIKQGDLSILEQNQTVEDRRGFPSWVVNWAKPISYRIYTDSGSIGRQFSACAHTKARAVVSQNDNGQPCLTLDGFAVSRVREVGKILTSANGMPRADSGAGLMPHQIEWLAELEDIAKRNHRHMCSDLSLTSLKEIYRIPIADQEHVPIVNGVAEQRLQAAAENSRRGYGLVTASFPAQPGIMRGKENPEEARHAISYCNRLDKTATYRRICSTFEGHLGLVPGPTQPEDLLCVFLGGEIPFIIREVMPGFYRLIGGAYVLGIMDGEVIAAGLKIRTFTIL